VTGTPDRGEAVMGEPMRFPTPAGGVHAGLVTDLLAAQPVGGLAHYPAVTSRFLPQAHDVIVCTPPGYAEEPERRYPVVYLHDGQNVFDEYPMAPFGVQWGVDTTARALAHARTIEPLILVAIGNAGRDRIDEYTPTRDAAHDAGGLADRYGQMLTYELKPFIDRHYRTKREASHTGLVGSSLGGLLTLHLGLSHPAVFGKLALLSPSVWWDDRWIVRQLVTTVGGRPDLTIWLDVGTQETRMLRGARLLLRVLQRRGWRLGEDLEYEEVDGGLHDERSWGLRIGRVLRFLFPGT
jgi:predicted alpha/beta superfamily hydrolase